MKEKNPAHILQVHTFFKQKSYEAFFPKRLELFNLATLNLINVKLLSTKETLTLRFEEEKLMCYFNISGDLNGNVLGYIAQKEEVDSDLLQEYHNSIFIESMNIIIGHFLSDIDKNYSLMSLLNHPSFFPPTLQSEKKKMFSRIKKESLFKEETKEYHFIKSSYELAYQKKSYPLDLFLRLRKKSII